MKVKNGIQGSEWNSIIQGSEMNYGSFMLGFFGVDLVISGFFLFVCRLGGFFLFVWGLFLS